MEKIKIRIPEAIGKDKRFIGYVEKQWIQRQCEHLAAGEDSTPVTIPFRSSTEEILLPVDVIQLQTISENDINLAKQFFQRTLKEGILAWEALLAYNRSYLAGDLFGSFYHFGPILPDQRSDELIQLNRVLFTFNGQGRETDEGGPTEAHKMVSLYPLINSTSPVTYVRLEDATFDSYPAEVFSPGVRQKAYLDALILRNDVPKFSKWNGLNFALWDSTGTLLTALGPKEDVVTYDGTGPVSVLGVRTQKERKSSFKDMYEQIKDVLGAQELPELVYLSLWEVSFDQTDASLLKKVLEKIQ